MGRWRELRTPAELRPDVSCDLGCLASVRGGFLTSQQTTYAVFPFPVERPATGKRRDTVTCPRCGAAVNFTVSSVERTLRKRRIYRIAYAIGTVLSLAATVVLAIAMPEDGVIGCVPLIVAGIGLGIGWAFHPPWVTGVNKLVTNQHAVAQTGYWPWNFRKS